MKSITINIVVGALVFLSLSSGAFCAQSGYQGGSHRGSGYSGSSSHQRGGYSGSSHRGSGHYGAGYHRGGHYYHHGGSRMFIGGYFGYPYYYPYGYPYYYPYDYSYYYPYPYAYTEPPVDVEPQEDAYWYYCQDPQGYYPYVTSCPGGWLKVVPTPPPPGKEGK